MTALDGIRVLDLSRVLAGPYWEVPLIGVPFRFSGTPAVAGAAPPGVGEHTAAVLRELPQMREKEIEELRRAGAVN